MVGKGKLTTFLTNQPLDLKKLMVYGRSKKLDIDDLGKLALTYAEAIKQYGSSVTPLHVACAHSKPDIVAVLLKEGWSMNHFKEGIESPFYVSLQFGNIPVARMLIEMGAGVKARNPIGKTPMSAALCIDKKEKTCISAIKLLLDAGVSINDVVDKYSKERALHVAVYNNSPMVVSFLLQRGADGNCRDIEEITPLFIAAECNRLEIVKLLILHKVDLYAENITHNPPIETAIKNRHFDVVEAFIKGGYDINKSFSDRLSAPLHVAVYGSDLDMVKFLISFGADVNNQPSSSGNSPLHVVGFKNILQGEVNSEIRLNISELLVKHGGKLNSVNVKMETPLEVAIHCGFLKLAKLLIELGAPVNKMFAKNEGNTIFHEVVTLNCDIIVMFLEFGADFNAQNRLKFSPYHVAISKRVNLKFLNSFIKFGVPYNQNHHKWSSMKSKCSPEAEILFAAEKKFFKGIIENNLGLVQSAVKGGAEPSGCCEEVRHPLHFVAVKGFKEILTFLLKEKVSPNPLNEKGETPLYLAAEQGHYEICRILLSYGACYNYSSKKCPKSPAMIAKEFNHECVLKLLLAVDRIFHLSRKKQKDFMMSEIERKLKNSRDQYLIFANAINKRGDTLFATALRHSQCRLVRELITLRLKCDLQDNK